MVGRRFGRPMRGDLLLMMGINALVSLGILMIAYVLFGVHSLLATKLAALSGETLAYEKLLLLLFMLPGAGIGYGCLWYWLILTGRGRAFNWGAAIFYGIGIGYANLPFTGFLIGMLYGEPLFVALVALALLFVLPPLLAGTTAFGVLMGLFNGGIAQRWIDYHRKS